MTAVFASDLSQRRRCVLENDDDELGRTEILLIEVMLRKGNWLLCSLDKQPKLEYCELIYLIVFMLLFLSLHYAMELSI